MPHIIAYQHTIQKPVSCCGAGLHSGKAAHLTIKPAPPANGITFYRTDLPTKSRKIKAHIGMVSGTHLATTIGYNGTRVSTVEHLLAALHSSGIDNVDIEVDSAEVPIMDGSAEPFIKLIKQAGIKRQPYLRTYLRIKRPISYRSGATTIRIEPHDGFKVSAKIRFNDSLIKTQSFSNEISTEQFTRDISRARTFGYVEEVEELWANGLALGSSLANVIAIHWNRKSILNEDGLRYDDEFIRHKVLDLVGDLSLIGYPLLGHVHALKAGHAQHIAFLKEITEHPDCWELIQFGADGYQAVLDRKNLIVQPPRVTQPTLVMAS